MDLIEQEIKRGNAGFVKWEKYDECHILSVFVNGLKNVLNQEVNVMLESGHSVGKLKIRNGKAEGTYLITKGEKDWVSEIEAIRIPLGEEQVLVAEFEGVKQRIKMQEEEEGTSDLASQSIWEVLGKNHELAYPMEGNMGCYRIFPKDINLLHANYHSLQNNQFLMHGYYNYRHLIIFPKKDSENEFWLGVPGIYHEREKMAARMFGFEKFEGTKKGYQVGDMGYYLITVEG